MEKVKNIVIVILSVFLIVMLFFVNKKVTTNENSIKVLEKKNDSLTSIQNELINDNKRKDVYINTIHDDIMKKEYKIKELENNIQRLKRKRNETNNYVNGLGVDEFTNEFSNYLDKKQ